MTQVMAGVRVVEVALFGLAPTAGAVLADWGADVVKVEHPVHGDPIRGLAAWGIRPGTGGFTYLWEACNRGKRSIGVDLATEAGRELVLELAAAADVFLTSFLPGARRRLGLDVADVQARNPRIIYARGSGLGPSGPEADSGSFDIAAYWHRCGVGTAAAPAGEWPVQMPAPAFGDAQTGMFLAGGIAAALFHRERTGEGSVVDASLLAAGLWANQGCVIGAGVLGEEDLPKPDRTKAVNALANIYRTADSRYIMLTMLAGDRYWQGLCDLIGRPDLADDPELGTAASRAKNRRRAVEVLDEVFASRTLGEWQVLLAKQDGPWAVAQTPGEAGRDPQAIANGYLQDVDYGSDRTLRLVSAPVQFNETAPGLRPAPELGAQTEEILVEMGRDWDKIIALKTEGVVT